MAHEKCAICLIAEAGTVPFSDGVQRIYLAGGDD